MVHSTSTRSWRICKGLSSHSVCGSLIQMVKEHNCDPWSCERMLQVPICWQMRSLDSFISSTLTSLMLALCVAGTQRNWLRMHLDLGLTHPMCQCYDHHLLIPCLVAEADARRHCAKEGTSTETERNMFWGYSRGGEESIAGFHVVIAMQIQCTDLPKLLDESVQSMKPDLKDNDSVREWNSIFNTKWVMMIPWCSPFMHQKFQETWSLDNQTQPRPSNWDWLCNILMMTSLGCLELSPPQCKQKQQTL